MLQPENVPAPDAVILLPRLKIQNANAISSPLTWGFPPPSAFLGFIHALERKLTQKLTAASDLKLTGTAICCHHFEPQVHKANNYAPGQFALTRNPVGKDGKPTSIVEEGRAHLEVSLLIAVKGLPRPSRCSPESIAEQVSQYTAAMRIAGGSVMGMRPAELHVLEGAGKSDDATSRYLRRRLLPGFVLVNRPDFMASRLAELQQGNNAATELDVLLDVSALTRSAQPVDEQSPDKKHGESESKNKDETVNWAIEKQPGWLVPLPLGFSAISPEYAAGSVKNTRDQQTPVRFVESALGIGQWLSPHRESNLNRLFWYHQTDHKTGLYLTANDYASA